MFRSALLSCATHLTVPTVLERTFSPEPIEHVLALAIVTLRG